MSAPEMLAAGRELMAWIRGGGRPERSSRLFLSLYGWRSFWLERSYAALRERRRRLETFPFPEGEGLILIQGFWRSGTTMLHEMLGSLPGCGAPCTWQCMEPSLLMAPSMRTGAGQGVVRPMDQVIVSADSPQEDEFALLAMGVPSLYRGFLDPRRLPELRPLLAQEYWSGSAAAWIETFEAFLAGVAEAEPKPKMLVLKSPNHLFRLRALEARFPRARSVWILRDPASVWRSNRKMWRAMIDRYSLWDAAPGALEEFLEAALCAFADLLEERLGQGEFVRHSAYRYEALVEQPATLLPALVDDLGAGPWAVLPPAVQSRLLALPKATEERRSLPTEGPTAVLQRLQRLQEEILQEAARHGAQAACALAPGGRTA